MRTIRTTEPGWRGALVLWLAITPWTASTLRAQGPSDSSATAGTPSGTDSGGAPTTITRPEAPASPEAAGSLVSAPEGPPKQQPTIPPAPTPLLLNRALKRQDSPVRVFGWIENSFTGNTNGTPPGRSNFGVFPNHLANSWQGNQYYFVVEDPLNQVDTVNFGFRLDTLFGNDWQFTKAYGLFDRAFPTNHFAGLDLPQLYGEVHLPVLTPWGLDIRGGRFYSLTGFESPQAIARPLLSVPYSLNFTPVHLFWGGLHPPLELAAEPGQRDGQRLRPLDRPSYKWGYLGALSWNSRDQKTTLVLGGVSAPDQLPRFPPANSPNLPVGVPSPPLLDGRLNPFYARSFRGYLIGVLSHKWSEKLTQAVETDHVFDPSILGFGNDPHVAHSAAYHSFVSWFLYAFNDKVTGVWRSEVFWDPYGLATGVADTFHETTLGLNVRPKPWLWVRPEARYDWAQFAHPFNDGTRKGQLTLSFDVIILF